MVGVLDGFAKENDETHTNMWSISYQTCIRKNASHQTVGFIEGLLLGVNEGSAASKSYKNIPTTLKNIVMLSLYKIYTVNFRVDLCFLKMQFWHV